MITKYLDSEPVIMLTLVYFILKDPEVEYKIVVAHEGNVISEIKGNKDIHIKVRKTDKKLTDRELKAIVKKREAVAAVSISPDLAKVKLYVDGSNAGDAAKVEGAVKKAVVNAMTNKQKKHVKKCL